MWAKTKKHNYTYILTNTINGIKYIGVRSCDCPIADDDYWGHSKYVDAAIEEVGKQNFTKEIIQDHDTRRAAAWQEGFFHNHYNVALNEGYYNKRKASSTSFDRSGVPVSKESRAKMSASQKGKKFTAETRKKISAGQKGKKNHRYDHTVRTIENPHATGDETKDFTGTQQEMLAEFPEMTPQGLGAMLRRIYQTHKGWRLLDFSV